MNKFILILTLISNFAFGQGLFKYSTYKMDSVKKSYSIMLDYNKNKELTNLILDVKSEDALFDESSFLFDNAQLDKFRAYLNFLLSKKIEWDLINKSNKTSNIIKRIDWGLGDVLVSCAYTDGPAKLNTYLYTMYSFDKTQSVIVISTAGSNDVKSSVIIFSNNLSLEQFIKKLDSEKIQIAINEDAKKMDLLK